jgi:hypothetical protein
MLLQVNAVVPQQMDGSYSIMSALQREPQRTASCECCCKCNKRGGSEHPSSPKASVAMTQTKSNMVAPSAGPHILRHTTDTEQIAQSLVTLSEPVKADTDRERLMGLVQLQQEPPSKQDQGPFVAGVAAKNTKVVQVAPATIATSLSNTRQEFHESQLASFASLAHDINLGTVAAGGAEVGVAWYPPPGIQITQVPDLSRNSIGQTAVVSFCIHSRVVSLMNVSFINRQPQ